MQGEERMEKLRRDEREERAIQQQPVQLERARLKGEVRKRRRRKRTKERERGERQIPMKWGGSKRLVPAASSPNHRPLTELALKRPFSFPPGLSTSLSLRAILLHPNLSVATVINPTLSLSPSATAAAPRWR
ncbi:uncharacterized protein BO88DRAFT_115790 [Aspergillus vadensis CBS 113365]|uniref:Uncharacterized protein n=1 Tax=Aspergillus vadensis (strain CBS 113365 / IMI 142717 / IBT 24658) TaxID=1448311 RepID=A0A319BKV8_ASPVC|nr:hypothetical protein BO88DRAFT_115790 [Aspergillus vadensis CBS 113365]PYH66333.1 hypothetical protein BO88DRAFT_115790 [Aspergillus vadensis CBS 113365]